MILAVSLVLSGCASTTSLSVNERQVKIYADGSYLGSGNTSYSDAKIAGASTDIMLEQDGCEAQHHTISRDTGVHVGALIGGFFFVVPFLWITKYKPGYRFNYVCQPTAEI